MHVSFAFVFTFLTLALTLVPSVVIWVLFSGLMDASVSLLEGTSASSLDAMATTVQEGFLQQAIQILDTQLSDGQNVMTSLQAWVNTTGLRARDLTTVDPQTEIFAKYQTNNWVIMKGHELFSYVVFQGAVFLNGTGYGSSGKRLWWVTAQALYIDFLTNKVGDRLIYYDPMYLINSTNCVMQIYYTDQDTGQAFFPVYTAHHTAYTYEITAPLIAWDTTLGFNAYTGMVELGAWAWLPCQNETWMQVGLGITAQSISQELAAELAGYPNDRLFIIWNQPHGTMLAASHGKYWSHSDVNQEQINILTNPIDFATYVLWTCDQSTDVLINSSCAQLYATYKSWTAIPDLNTAMVLNGTPYYVAVGHSYVSINITVIMLKDRSEVMGSIDASQAAVADSIATKKGVTYVILGVVSFFSVLLPLTLGLWLGSRLLRLAAEMEEIAKLEFDGVVAPATVFSELHRFQTSFTKMERGLRAFSKFVPQAVVKVLIAGKMDANQSMANQQLTIMFADIEGFSTICEAIHADDLAEVCTEYFESVCSIVVEHRGTIDKFIGDCIMAMWNAPLAEPQHERLAVESALEMQRSVLALHGAWQRRGLPILKFRAGVHTGPCLVGNFGCSYRVSYTCLGDSVNLASRLEAINKKFGTFICISQATLDGCRGRFKCRRLAKVTVPGKAEILPLHEVLCHSEQAAAPGMSHHEAIPLTVAPHADPQKRPAYALHAAATPTGLAVGIDPEAVVYHWQHVSRTRLLEHCAAYEAAYNALVQGDQPRARRLLQTGRVLDIPDTAWTALEEQLHQLGPNATWNGVFYFKEK